MIDFKLFGGFGDRQTDRRTDERTFVVVESLSRLKKILMHLSNQCTIIGTNIYHCIDSFEIKDE